MASIFKMSLLHRIIVSHRFKIELCASSELIVFPKERLTTINDEYDKIRKIYSGDYEQSIAQKEKILYELIERELIIENLINTNKLKEEFNDENRIIRIEVINQ
jgi:hypothetical protein